MSHIIERSLIKKALPFIDTAALPNQLQDLIQLLGLDDTYDLLEHLGGRVIYIAKDPNRTKLSQSVPTPILAQLSYCYGGSTIEFPKQDHFYRLIRNEVIQNEIEAGSPRKSLANKYNLTVRQISNIKSSGGNTRRAELQKILATCI
ncbi:Conserved hypothetical protein [Shewanella piezotolerans WP3]|uniref:Mor transcription activator domain-containing protein n=1 Tax=Shewanella piezotolerans (strain WP3 / JCM 13877) TaxID=225849 RepID=B8CUZ8_SHEPW|nr:Mor transcription activator family protein [Shewanella piezotolerans]ACJ31474.1 Conserved hypothetical protein [Shewanella piezotolerans WP3]